MKVFLTGNLGYIGSVMTGILKEKGHKITGYDSGYFSSESFRGIDGVEKQLLKDIRDVNREDLRGHDAVIHLAGLANDPSGDINPSLTTKINGEATVGLAELAKEVGIERFIFSSSCSVYGQTPGKLMDENSPLSPVSVYAEEKIIAEWRLSRLADQKFAPVYLRNATVFGYSPRMRFDLVVNNLAGWAYTTGAVRMMSDGTAWRPNVHVRDVANAFALALEAQSDKVRNRAFNVGANSQNHQVREIAEMVCKEIPGSTLEIVGRDKKDARSYNVDFSRIEGELGFRTEWSIPRGVEELRNHFERSKLTREEFENPLHANVRLLQFLMENKKLSRELRWMTT